MDLSRNLSQKAQERESVTIQPKEKLVGSKATITIKNYLGGLYYFTSDEAEIMKNDVCLIEGKHTETSELPSLGDIKDGLIKMILFTNLEDVRVGNKSYKSVPILKLTAEDSFKSEFLKKSSKEAIEALKNEAKTNGFRILINNSFLV